MPKLLQKQISGIVILTLLVGWLSPIFIGQSLAFSNLLNRSISISTSAGGVVAVHTFSFNFPVSESVGSIRFQYCTDPIDEITCDTPVGLDASAPNLDSQAGQTGFSILSSSVNQIILTRSPSTVDAQQNSYVFSNITNPSSIGPFFVRISAYTSTDATGNYISFSSVAGSITTGININAEVPPILYFCSAVSVPTNDCSDAVGDFIEFGTLKTNDTSAATSQFLVGTNAPNGYSISANGQTMSSGTDEIDPLAIPSDNRTGVSQFGLNLRANLAPPVGADSVGGSGNAGPTAGYDTPNKFRYTDGDVVAQGTGPTLIQRYTVSYIVNVPASQPAGIYNTTLTYVCTAGF